MSVARQDNPSTQGPRLASSGAEDGPEGFLGIVFVCHSTQRGDQLVFRYPEVVRNRVTQETLRAYTTRHVSSDAVPGGNAGGSGGGSSTGGGASRPRIPSGRSQTQPGLGTRRSLVRPLSVPPLHNDQAPLSEISFSPPHFYTFRCQPRAERRTSEANLL